MIIRPNMHLHAGRVVVTTVGASKIVQTASGSTNTRTVQPTRAPGNPKPNQSEPYTVFAGTTPTFFPHHNHSGHPHHNHSGHLHHNHSDHPHHNHSGHSAPQRHPKPLPRPICVWGVTTPAPPPYTNTLFLGDSDIARWPTARATPPCCDHVVIGP